MVKYMKCLFICLALLFITYSHLAAQDSTIVFLRVKVEQDNIRLRWAVNSPAAWMQANKYGYRIERYTVMRDEIWLPQAEQKIITALLKPQPLEEWAAIAPANDYAAVIAQALYGDSFEIDAGTSGNITAIFNRSQEQEQRYFMALYAADRSFQAACMAGMGWIDADVKEGERYLYRVISHCPAAGIYAEPGIAYVGWSDYTVLPRPQGLAAQFGDHTVMLAWDYRLLENIYGSYYVERSDDNRYFRRLTATPLAPAEGIDGNPAPRMYYLDSLASDTTTYYYRIVGLDAFGDEGPPSDTLKGKSIPALKYTPQIIRAVTNEAGILEIDWEFEQQGEEQLKSFVLQYAPDRSGLFVNVLENIAPSQRHVTYDKLESTNYFRIAAVSYEGAMRAGFPVLVQPVDTIPPATPTGLKGSIDSSGVVHLSWNSNTDADLYGYRIYRGMTDGEELIPLNDVALRHEAFVDTVQLKNLNPKVYYAITALDHRYNQSSLSPVCILTKPDIVPPSSPLLTEYISTEKGILLQWEPAPDPDVAQYVLYRQPGADPYVLFAAADTLTGYLDTAVVARVVYRYYMVAVDSAGLRSSPSPIVAVQAIKKDNSPRIVEKLTVVINKEKQQIILTWTHRIPFVTAFAIYRAIGDDALSLWQTIEGEQLKVTDEELQRNKKHRYGVRPIMPDGSYGELLEKEINY